MKLRVLGAFLAIFASLSFNSIAQTEQIVNGGFENGFVGWTNYTFGQGQTASSNPQFAHTGSGYLKMGIIPNATAIAAQTVTLPTSTIYARLSLWMNSMSQVAGDAIFSVSVRNTNASLTLLTNYTSFALPLGGTQGTSSYIPIGPFDLTPFAGKTVVLAFELDTGNQGAGDYLALDDISLLLGTTADIPPNDNFTNRITLNGTNVSSTENTFFASVEVSEPFHAGNVGGRSVWWTWTAPSDGILQLDTSGSDYTTLLAVYTGTALSNLVKVASDNAFTEGSGFASVKFAVHAGTNYQIAIDGFNQGSGADFGTAHLNLHFAPDKTAPKVTITSPAANFKLSTDTITFHGTASDNVGVAGVEYRLENVAGTNSYSPTTGTNQWFVLITNMVPGPNTLRVRAFDTAGNTSAPVTRTVMFVVNGNLTLLTNGIGTITAVPRPPLFVGNTYTIEAKPGPNNLFSNWTGDVFSSNPKLTFIMQTNMTIQANFVTNVFLALKGTYAGLFLPTTNDITTSNAGYFKATVSSSGGLSARLTLPIISASASAKINVDGSFSNNIVRPGKTPIVFTGQLDLSGGNKITGQFSADGQTSDLLANLAVYSSKNHSPFAGSRYTIVIPPGAMSAEFPGGYGNGSILVDPSGNVAFTGESGDNTKVKPIKSFISQDGLWPFFATPYGKLGSIIGWLAFDTSNVSTPPTGDLNWLKLSNNAAKFYPAGFEENITTLNSPYTGSNGAPIFTWTNGLAVLAGGNLSQAITNPFTIGANNKVFGSNGMSLTLTATTGAFKGSVKNGAKSIPISGTVNQLSDEGYGVFSGTDETGSVILIPASP